jgi:hypothetical protein
MNQPSRRQFLAATGAGAVAVGSVTTLSGVLAGPAAAAETSTAEPGRYDEAVPVIVTLDDVKAGRLSVMHGEREFTIVDAKLASRIARLAGKGA